MDNLQNASIVGLLIILSKLIWALAAPVVIFLMVRKTWVITAKWISYTLMVVACIQLFNAIPLILARTLSVHQYGTIQIISTFLNAIGAIAFLVAAYGIANDLKKQTERAVLVIRSK
jgi:hypothetical protein